MTYPAGAPQGYFYTSGIDPTTGLPITNTGGSSSSPMYASLVETAPTPNGYQQIAPAASTALTIPANSTRAVISTTGADIRWRIDATAPTASVGNIVPTGSELVLIGAANLALFKCIQTAATASVNVQYFL